jgi:hypothetical protein
MSAINDGGPAFPEKRATKMFVSGPDGQPEPIFETIGGMTLRDWFAGQSLSGLLQISTGDTLNGKRYADHVAASAYEMADAMLKAREAQS